MTAQLLKLFNLRANEWPRVSLLFLISLLLNVAAVWGTTTAYAAFLKQAGVGALPWILVSSSLLSVLASAIYTAFVDRIPNDTLLIALFVLYAVFIASGLALLLSGVVVLGIVMATVAFPLLYLLDAAWTVVFNAHFFTFLNNLYDIQSAKRIQPLSAAGFRAGSIVAGLTLSLLTTRVDQPVIIAIWLGTTLAMAALVWGMPLILKEKRGRVEPPRQSASTKGHESYVSSMVEGLSQIRQSSFMLWTAISTGVLMILVSLLEYQSSGLLLRSFGTSKEFASYLALLTGLGNLFVLPVLLFLTSRLIARLGVGNASMIFPLGNLLACAGLVLLPGVPSASAAYFDRSAFRVSFYTPVNNLLYNAVPVRIRGRSRAFVTGVVVPLGSLVGGLLLLLPMVATVDWFVPALIGSLATLYLVSAFLIRRRYAQALVKMLEEEDYSFLLSQEASELTAADPTTLTQLQKKLEASANHELTIFLAQLIVKVGGAQALPILAAVTRSTGEARTRAALIDVLTASDLRSDAITQLYSDSLADPEPHVRQAAISGLQQISTPSDKSFIEQMLTLVEDADLGVRLRALSALTRSEGFYDLAPAVQALDQLLAGEDSQARSAGIVILTKIGTRTRSVVERTVNRLLDYMGDSSDQVRLDAATGLEEITKGVADPSRKGIFNESLDGQIVTRTKHLLNDPVERVRAAALVILAQMGTREARQAMLGALGDPSAEVRAVAVNSLAHIGKPVIPLIHPSLNSPDAQIRKMAAVVLSKINPREFSSLITETHITGNLLSIYRNYGEVQALDPCARYSAIDILQRALREQNEQATDEIFYLLGAIHDPDAVKVIHDSLRSPDSRMQANAREALESLTTPQTANLVAPLFETNVSLTHLLDLSKETWEMEHSSTSETIQQLAGATADPWLRTVTLFALGQIGTALTPVQPPIAPPPPPPDAPTATADAPASDSQASRRGRRGRGVDLLGALGGGEDAVDKKETAAPKPEPVAPPPAVTPSPSATPSESGLTRAEIQSLLDAAAADSIPEVRRAALAALRTMAAGGVQLAKGSTTLLHEEEQMLSSIEKIIFLKQVPFFQGMTVEQLRVLANVCEEEFFAADTRLFNEGDAGGVLYVVVSGRVGIEQEKRKGSFARLANIDAYSYFGEMNLFDNSVRTTSAVATQDTLTLRIRREPLIALARQHPDLSLELINVLSQRLRETSDRVAELTRTRPRELHKLYDAFDS
ncbi:MAG: Npt1/Npt2 family nucleotide transporter [Anaerolineae bacterium]